jgi:hypothetical protein
MVHVKWFAALVLTAVLSAYVSHFFTEKYAIETAVAQLSDVGMGRTNTYISLVKLIDDGKPDDARKKLEKLWQLEVDLIKDYQKILEGGYFRNSNSLEIDRIARYLSPTPAVSAPAK